MLVDAFRLMARYNQWMNETLYNAALGLPETVLVAEQGAFFGSILGTLNHIAVADTIWLHRFVEHPARPVALMAMSEVKQPSSLDAALFDTIQALRAYRQWLDQVILGWVAELSEDHLAQSFSYSNSSGKRFTRQFDGVVLHFFNHQTHHRGQATTLLSQAGADVGVTDLAALLPDVE